LLRLNLHAEDKRDAHKTYGFPHNSPPNQTHYFNV
jgi:hypothetical protein